MCEQTKLRELSCEARTENTLKGRIDDIQRLWSAYCEGHDEVADLGSIHDYLYANSKCHRAAHRCLMPIDFCSARAGGVHTSSP